MKPAFLLRSLVAAALAAAAGTSFAVNDPIGDFLPSYTGVHAADLDVVSSFVTYNPGSDTFFFSGTMNGAIGTTSTAFYVWGLDRGTGTARFGALADHVLFDSVVILRLDGSASVNLLPGATNLPGVATFAGNTISASISGSLLPGTGFAKSAYTWNLWPRDGSQPAGNGQISDFAPDNSNVDVAVVPEPSTLALLALGLGALGWRVKRRSGA